jgi:hypothetical protein
MRAIVTGMIATYPVGGVAWDYGQYALGLEHLGYEVYYLEDTGGETYDPTKGLYSQDCSYGVRFLQNSLEQLSPSLSERWHFRSMDGHTFGIEANELARIVAEADVFLNVSGSALLRPEYMRSHRKVLIDTDPGWNHFVNYPRWDARPEWQGALGFRAHDHFYTYAQCIGRPECALPELGIHWNATVPPVVLECWQPKPLGEKWSTVMTWDNFRRPIEGNGVVYGTKELEFNRVEHLPQCISFPFELAVGGTGGPQEHWRNLGWSVIDSHAVSTTLDDYRSYIEASRGEFSVAKNVYVATNSGWFSCRSVCYLASSRPIVVQDTGFSNFVPTGEGLFAFSNLDEAVCAVKEIESNYEHHQEAARHMACTHFDAQLVLSTLLHQIGL